MSAITTAAEAEAAIAQLSDLIAKLRMVVEEETALVHAGKVRNAATLGPVKSELATRLYIVGETMKANAKFLTQSAPASTAALHAMQETFRAVLQRNMVVLATAHAVSEGIVRGFPATLRATERRTFTAPPAAPPRPIRNRDSRWPSAACCSLWKRSAGDTGQLVPYPRERRIPVADRTLPEQAMVGYQGLSVNIHLKSGANGTSRPIAFPIAPARCATDVSTAMTRSSIAKTAAVSAKSSNSGPSCATP